MIVRALDNNGDWTFGQGLNNYYKNLDAVKQNIKTRILSFLGNCFFDVVAGIDWFNLLGSKNERALSLSISSVILNTTNVTGILQLSLNVNPNNREFSVSYQAQTAYSLISDIFQYNLINSAGTGD